MPLEIANGDAQDEGLARDPSSLQSAPLQTEPILSQQDAW